MGLKPWREIWTAEATDVRVFCIQMRADTMKMDEAMGESLGEEVKGGTLGNACIQDEEGNQRRSSQSNNLKFSRLSQKIKKKKEAQGVGGSHQEVLHRGQKGAWRSSFMSLLARSHIGFQAQGLKREQMGCSMYICGCLSLLLASSFCLLTICSLSRLCASFENLLTLRIQ